MRNILILTFALFCFSVKAQDAPIKFPGVDASPLDVVYFPLRAANVKADDPTKPNIKVIYSRPQKKNRVVFGELEKFGQVWRVGANESTEIRFYQDVTIGDKNIKAGIYNLFAIPTKDKWTMIINSVTDRWGAYTYDQSKDIVRVDVPTKATPSTVEYLSITFTPSEKGANLIVAWDNTMVDLPISFKK